MESNILTVTLSADDKKKIQQLMERHPELRTYEDAVLWALRHYDDEKISLQNIIRFDEKIFKTSGINPYPAPTIRRGLKNKP